MTTPKSPLPLLGFAAFSGVGKTTLLVQLLALFQKQRVRIGIIKHAHHSFDIDHPGKDSYRLRKAGAQQTLIASKNRWALIHENAVANEPRLEDLIARLDPNTLDLILVEGFKDVPFPKIELHRPSLGHPLLLSTDDSIIAVATDDTTAIDTELPILNLNDPPTIAQFILQRFGGEIKYEENL